MLGEKGGKGLGVCVLESTSAFKVKSFEKWGRDKGTKVVQEKAVGREVVWSWREVIRRLSKRGNIVF